MSSVGLHTFMSNGGDTGSRLFDLLMQAPVAVAVFSGPDHRFEVANPAFCTMVGRTELIGCLVREAFPEIGEHHAIATLDQVFETGTTLRITELLIPIRRGDAPRDAWFDYVLQPLRDETGEVTGVMTVAVEVTEQVLARKHVEELRAAAEQANRTKDEFLAMLGHELRNPLSPIVTALHLMRLRAGSVIEKERVIIERQVNHLVRLVDDLLDISRITRGKIELKKARVEIADVVRKAIEVACPLLEERQQHLSVSVPPRNLLVDVDATRLQQVIANLLTNAAKYTDRGGHITVNATREDDTIVVQVRDDGIGIAAEMLPRVFDTFTQEQQALDRSRGGLGLGLAIVRSLVSLHGGTVSAYSEGRGRGSEFFVRLPAASRTERTVAAEANTRLRAPRPPRARRILVVDDNEDLAILLAESLEALGHETHVAHDGLEALRVASKVLPDVGLIDIGLPVMDGYEVARRIRESGELCTMRLVAVTGYGQESNRRRSMEVGFDAHLVKPVDLARLQAVIDELCEKSALEGPSTLATA